ncbi:MAG: hypothetical protein CM1200mP30_04260 [Pseudomonadota bacterium]|nr:MAG: hypothetical protein CM1200mP30_04260 [Pseudomonadota bacterium]
MLVEGGVYLCKLSQKWCCGPAGIIHWTQNNWRTGTLSWCGELGFDQLDQALQIDIRSITAVGEDWLIDAKIK